MLIAFGLSKACFVGVLWQLAIFAEQAALSFPADLSEQQAAVFWAGLAGFASSAKEITAEATSTIERASIFISGSESYRPKDFNPLIFPPP